MWNALDLYSVQNTLNSQQFGLVHDPLFPELDRETAEREGRPNPVSDTPESEISVGGWQVAFGIAMLLLALVVAWCEA